MSFNFMATITICSDFRTGVKCHISPLFFSLFHIPYYGVEHSQQSLFHIGHGKLEWV